MNLHRRWAARRAWRTRALLAIPLAIAAWLLRAWLGYAALLLPLASLLYSSRWQESRALAEIDIALGLAYRTALETPPEEPAYQRLRLQAEEIERSATLPRLPWPTLLLAAALWLAAGLVPAPQIAPPTVRQGPLLPAENGQTEGRDGGERTSESRTAKQGKTGLEDQQTGSGEVALGGNGEKTSGAGEEGSRPASQDSAPTGEEGILKRERPPGAPPQEEGTQTASAGEEGPASQSQARSEKGGNDAAGEKSAPAARQDGSGSGAGGAPGNQAGTREKPAAMPVPTPRAAGKLPSPWEEGSPPQEVKQAAERYIENNPLPPGAARALRRYFELGD
ncbi:hypothetical protein [Oceanithermus sp.]